MNITAPVPSAIQKTSSLSSSTLTSKTAYSLKQLQSGDIYFSARSTRSQLDRFLDHSKTTHLLFHFTAPCPLPGWVQKILPPPSINSASLVLTKQIPSDQSTDTTDKMDPPIQAYWVKHAPLTQVSLLLDAFRFSWDGHLSTPKTVAFLPKKISLRPWPLPSLESQTATENPVFSPVTPTDSTRFILKNRPWLQKLHQFIHKYLPSGRLGPLTFYPDGRITLLNQWEWSLGSYWETTERERVVPIQLLKLPNGPMTQVHTWRNIGLFPSMEGAFRKAFKERVLQEVALLESQGYQLVQPSTPDSLTPVSFLNPVQKSAPNPFNITRLQTEQSKFSPLPL